MSNVEALTGNECVAQAVRLCRPDVIAAYPITPQSSVVEKLAAMVSNGELDSRIVDVESEHSSMSVVKGAALVGKRVFTATAGQGLAYMYEPYFTMSTMRLPMVMTIANREMISPGTVWSGLQDALSVRDCGWIQVFVENNQEILDMVVQGYKVSEDAEVRIPVNVCYDGFYLSHQTERVEIPDKGEVDRFLPPFDGPQLLDVNHPAVLDPNTVGEYLIDYREDHLNSMNYAKTAIQRANDDFAALFKRDYGGLIDTYRLEDADIAILTMGAATGAAREAVDLLRAKGCAVGLVKVRFMRPFPAGEIAEALQGRKAFGVIDKSVCFGWNTGILYEETLAALGRAGIALPSVSFIGGLGGMDIRTEHLCRAIGCVRELAAGTRLPGTIWLKEDFI